MSDSGSFATVPTARRPGARTVAPLVATVKSSAKSYVGSKALFSTRMEEQRNTIGARAEGIWRGGGTKSNGVPWDRVDKVRRAQDGLVNRIGQLKRLLGDSRTSPGDRAHYQAELAEASQLRWCD